MPDSLRVGLIGTSAWAEEFYISNLKSHPTVTLAAICGRNQSRAAALASKHGVSTVFTD